MYRNIKEGNQEADRTFWDILSCLWPDWRRSLYIVQPETVINWHRRGFRYYWRWRKLPQIVDQR